jgi:hypothetical protein
VLIDYAGFSEKCFLKLSRQGYNIHRNSDNKQTGGARMLIIKGEIWACAAT